MSKLKNNIFEDITAAPKEHYTFRFEPDEIDPIQKKYTNKMKMPGLIAPAVIMLLLFNGIFFNEDMIWFSFGVLFVWITMGIGVVLGSKKMYEKRRAKFSNTLYDYTLYDNFLIVWISSDDSIRQRKILLHEIKRAITIKNFVVVEIDNELHLMRKRELAADSYFLSICDKKKKRGDIK